MKVVRKKTSLWLLTLLLLGAHIFFRSQAAHAEPPVVWKEILPRSGNCKISFPSLPQLIQQSFKVDEVGTRLNYDVYLASYQNRGVCILLIAQYPTAIPVGQELLGLQGLVRGIVSQNVENKLLFSDSVENQLFPALNFLVNSGKNYFRAQAIMVGSRLYMIGMEGGKQYFDEAVFQQFLNSFQLIND